MRGLKYSLYSLGLVVVCLVLLGLYVLSSASEPNGLKLHHDAFFFLVRQVKYLVFALVLCVGLACWDYRFWRDRWWVTALGYVGVFLLLLAVFLFQKVNGSYRWINLGFIRLQPSELAKVMTVIIVSIWLDMQGWRVEFFKRGVLGTSAFIVVLLAPIAFEPDFGSMMVVGAVGGLLMVVAGVWWRYIISLASLGSLVFGLLIFKNANRMARLSAYFGMGDDPSQTSDMAYQTRMALVAIQRGGLFGVGTGDSMQKHAYLPEAHTDFIFAVAAEEHGLVFTIVTFTLYLTFFFLAVYIARKATDRLGRFFVIGMTFLIVFQAFFNLGVVCGVMPSKGMALPFFSYGGSNLIATFAAIGIIFSVGIHSYRAQNVRGTTFSCKR